jgi:protein-tyrosine phosphatase
MVPENPDSRRTTVLFVCLGNICRSPLAEGVFTHLVREAGLADRFTVDSAGTGAWHVGEPPDARASMVASQHGVELLSRARQITGRDLERFDWVIAMDRENLRNIERMAETIDARARIHLLREFDRDRDSDEVPDPYYGDVRSFETVYGIVHRSCEALLERLLSTA